MQSHTKSKLLAFLHPKQIKGERKHTFTLLSQAKEKEEFAFDTRSQSVSIFLVVSWGHLGQKENLILFQQSSFLGEMLATHFRRSCGCVSSQSSKAYLDFQPGHIGWGVGISFVNKGFVSKGASLGGYVCCKVDIYVPSSAQAFLSQAFLSERSIASLLRFLEA